ncbi:MAG: ferrous iron transport protein B [Thermoplasmatales archaeon]|nr:ferrous iron transport protein B [Thermoplasmatales archaeon]
MKISIIGQPNVGKSSLFTRLTGVGVITSNYPGTTVEFEESAITRGGTRITFRDLPGTYSITGNSDDELVVTKDILSRDADAFLLVVDSTNPEPSLVLAMETLELGVPAIIALNKIDVGNKLFDIDHDALSETLGVPVVPVSAKTGEGIDALADAIVAGSAAVSGHRIRYDSHIEEYLLGLEATLGRTEFSARGIAVKTLEASKPFSGLAPSETVSLAEAYSRIFEESHGESIDVHIARDRFGDAHIVASKAFAKTTRQRTLSEKISDLTTDVMTGIPILIGVLALTFLTFVAVGTFLDELIADAYDAYVGTAIIDYGQANFGTFGAAVFEGIDTSIVTLLGLVVPYIMVFYILLGILEDTGYLPRAVVLLDNAMHRMGLHGGAFIPMLMGLGCNVPAIMGVRTIKSRREKIILSTIIAMAVPCSAQLAIIIGITGRYAGLGMSFAIFAILLALAVVAGAVMDRVMRFEPTNLALELPPLSMPMPRNVLLKMWYRVKDFFVIAAPLLVVGSIAIELLLSYGLLDKLIDPMSFLTVGILGLPAATIVAFIVGIIRKEMAAGMLITLAAAQGLTLATFMTPDQFAVFGLVMAIYIPCLATIAAMWREIGWKETLAVSTLSIIVAIAAGAAMNLALGLF